MTESPIASLTADFEMSGLFEHLAATDDTAFVAHRQATAVANKRVRDRFGAFLANANHDLSARLALVEDDVTEIVNDVVAEYGGDAQKIEAAIKKSLGMPGAGGAPGLGGPMGGGVPGAGAGTGMPTPGGGQQTCPTCGGPMVNGQCPTCQGGAYGGAGAPAGQYGLTHSIPQGPSSGPIQASHQAAGGFCDDCKKWKNGPNAGCTCSDAASNTDASQDVSPEEVERERKNAEGDDKESSVHLARRPKMCPYHSEVVDISLGSGDAQAGFNAMASHAWGDKHCKGGYEGNCNFRPAMVTQKYWDDKQTEYQDRREQRELDRAQADPIHNPEPELSIDTEPIMHAEPLPDEPGKEGVSDIDGELANAPSAVGGGELAMAASTRKEAEALETVDLPTGDESGLGGPSPKIDKGPSGDQGGWSLDPIDTQMDGSPHPSIAQDPTDKADYNKADFLAQTDAVTKQETLPTGTGMDDAGFDPERNITQYPTKTFGDNGTNPVTRESLSHQRQSINITDMPMMQPAGSGNQSQQAGAQPTVGDPQTGMNISPEAYAQFQADAQQWRRDRGIPEQPTTPQDIWPNSGPASTPPTLSATDPDKNPIREILDTYDRGFLPAFTIERALNGYEES